MSDGSDESENEDGFTKEEMLQDGPSVERVDADDVRERLDFHPSSGSVGSDQKQYDSRVPPYSRGENRTTWSQRDTERNSISRVGENVDEWEWKKRLNSDHQTTDGEEKEILTDWRGKDRDRKRFNDLQILVDQIESLTEEEKGWLLSESYGLYRNIKSNREEGFRFGGGRPIELIEIALLTLAARRLMDPDDFGTSEEGGALGKVAFGNDIIDNLCKDWSPKSVDCSSEDIRKIRGELQECISDE